MEEVSIIGLDLAKKSFQLHSARAGGAVVFRKKLSRSQVPALITGGERSANWVMMFV